MPLLNLAEDHRQLAAKGGRHSGPTKQDWPAWKRLMHGSIAALYRWHPEQLTVTIEEQDTTGAVTTGAVTTRRVALSYAQSCAAWQAGFRVGFEQGAGYRKRLSVKS